MQKDLEMGAQKGRKTVMVVGRMGHGKSSFCRMLVKEEEKDVLKSKASFRSVTEKCQLCLIDREKSPIEEDLYLMDTPGLDAENRILLAIEQIDDFIFQEKLEIVAIIYVLDLYAGR